MYNIDSETDSVNRKFSGTASDTLLRACGSHWELKEFHEKPYFYGYTREKKKIKDDKVVDVLFGRAAEADDEDKETNRRRVNYRRKKAVMDLINCNETALTVWHTFVDASGKMSLDRFHQERKNYTRRLETFVQTGKLYKKPVIGLTPKPAFRLNAVGVIDFQDGERRADKQGRGAIHAHQVMNTPFLPQVQVIVADVFDPQDSEYKQAYLQQGGCWSLVANRKTRWFNTSREVETYLQAHPELQDAFHKTPRKKPLCVAAMLWEHGFIDIRLTKNMRKAGQCSNVGEYMVSKYMLENTEDRRLDGRKAYFFVGNMEHPTIIHDPQDIEQHLLEYGAWGCLVSEKHFQAYYMGLMTVYLFNFWVLAYPWIRRYYELKAQKQKMTRADWLACGVEQEHPLLL